MVRVLRPTAVSLLRAGLRAAPSTGLTVALTVALPLALSGCAGVFGSSSGASDSRAPSRAPKADADADLSSFSPAERDRILAVQAIVEQAAAEHELDPSLINAIIWVESRFEPRAESPAGARGLMQLMPQTAAYLAKRMGERSPRSYDPEFNVRAGALYLAAMHGRFGDERHAVAAYHAGPGNVRKWVDAGRDFPDYSRSYVAKVMAARERFRGVGSTSGALAVQDDDPGMPPALDTLPTAAEIHGLPRARQPQRPPAEQPVERDALAAQPQPAPAPQPVPDPVFVPHPELDANPKASAGWGVDTGGRRDTPRSRPSRKARERPAPKPAPEPPAAQPPPPEPAPEDDAIGLGVLPDL